jgi:type VI secretion system protein ImpA
VVGVPAARESAAAAMPAREPLDTKSPGRQLAAICRAMRAQDPEDAAPYLILRSFAWARLQQNAPLIDHSAIDAPPGDLRVTLKRATADSDWDRVLELTENAMLLPCAGYWLDLQRYAVNAIEQKGFPATARVVNNCLRVLLEALPDLVEITLPDDTPAANAETKNWITNNVIIQRVPRGRGDQTEETPSSDDTSSTDFSFDLSTTTEETPTDTTFSFDSEPTPETTDETPAEPAEEPKEFVVDENPPILDDESAPSDISDEFTQALRAIRKGTTEDGLQIITALLATERSGRARFRRRTQLAHLLLAAGKGAVAMPILDQIASEIEDRRLEDWEESEALAYPLDLLMQCLGRADGERKAALYARICKLDPVRALRSSP